MIIYQIILLLNNYKGGYSVWDRHLQLTYGLCSIVHMWWHHMKTVVMTSTQGAKSTQPRYLIIILQLPHTSSTLQLSSKHQAT